LFAVSAAQAQFTVTDTTMFPANYTQTPIAIGTGGSSTDFFRTTGGNGGSHLEVRTINNANGGFGTTFISSQWYWDPSLGGLTNFDFSFDVIRKAGDFSSITLAFAIQQDDEIFISQQFAFNAPTWTTLSVNGQAYTSFNKLVPSSLLVDPTSMPDFSTSGEIIRAGYMVFGSGFDETTRMTGVDNFTVSSNVEAVPKPATLTVIGLGLATLARRRYKN
nr:PEP-CTERM sorting domain-containing protein [Fimbriimonadaceae bacterium]